VFTSNDCCDSIYSGPSRSRQLKLYNARSVSQYPSAVSLIALGVAVGVEVAVDVALAVGVRVEVGVAIAVVVGFRVPLPQLL
jgi:hypothetical protein